MNVKDIRRQMSKLKNLINQKSNHLEKYRKFKGLDKNIETDAIENLKRIQDYTDEYKRLEELLILKMSQVHRGIEINGFTDNII